MTVSAQRIAADFNALLPAGENGGAATAAMNLVAEIAARGRDVLLLVRASNASVVDHLLGPHVERYVVRTESVTPHRNPAAVPWPPPWSLTRALGADVYFCPFGDPFWAEDGVATVCTINDVQHLDHPERFAAGELAHRADYLSRLVAVADRIIVPSEFTRRSVEAHLAPSAPQSVVPYPAERAWIRSSATPGTPDSPRRNGHTPFLLYPANAWPHKNHDRLLRAMAVHRERCAQNGRTPVRLACTGSPLGRRGDLEQRIVELGLSGFVDVLGHVPDDDLLELFRRSRGLLFPSLYEGFGLPVLEAMALGVPVACSDRTSLPEIAGGAALLFDPEQPEAIADAIDALAFDDTLAADLVARGRNRVAAFATDRCVDTLLRVFDDAAASVRHGRAGVAIAGDAIRPTVAVVMPSFEQVDYIERTIDSVMAQGDVVSDFIVFDGASRDGTVAVLDAHHDVLDFVSEPDSGQAAAVNKGIAKADADVVAWLNSDDIYYPGALDAAATVFAHHPELDWVYFAADHIDADDELIEPYYDRPWDAALFRDSCFICQPATFFRTSFVREVGGLDESLRYCMDYELWFRMSRVHAPVYVPVITSASRLHPATKTLGQRTAVLRETVEMLARTNGKASQWWLLGQIGDRVDQHRDWDMTSAADGRSRHRYALSVAARTFASQRTIPDAPTQRILVTWARESIGRPAPAMHALHPRSLASRIGARLSPRTRRLLGYPYHLPTRWVRRRTIYELEPRFREIEKGVIAGHRAIEEIRMAMATQSDHIGRGRADLQLERVVFQHHQVEEALVDRISAELEALRAELERLRAAIDVR